VFLGSRAFIVVTARPAVEREQALMTLLSRSIHSTGTWSTARVSPLSFQVSPTSPRKARTAHLQFIPLRMSRTSYLTPVRCVPPVSRRFCKRIYVVATNTMLQRGIDVLVVRSLSNRVGVGYGMPNRQSRRKSIHQGIPRPSPKLTRNISHAPRQRRGPRTRTSRQQANCVSRHPRRSTSPPTY
jgi:hypothetical protein